MEKMEKKHAFKAEVRQLLDLVIHSLYSKKEIFLRELISNASDAIDRAQYEGLTDKTLIEGAAEWRIDLTADKKARTLTITDNGIGMTAAEAEKIPSRPRARQGGLWHGICSHGLHPKETSSMNMNKLSIAALAAAFAVAAFAEPAAKARSIVIEPKAFVKDRNVHIEKDNIDNFQYARLANFDTNAPVTAISYKVPAAQAGQWHVLLDLRSGAAVALDQDAALATVEAPADPKAGSATNAPLASVHVTGSLGDEAWQIVSLGVVDLPAGAVIRLAPRADASAAPVPRYTDLCRITLLDPDFISETREALGGGK